MSKTFINYRDVRPATENEVSIVFGVETESGLKVGLNALLGNCCMLGGKDASGLQQECLEGLASYAESTEYVEITAEILKDFIQECGWKVWIRKVPAKTTNTETAVPNGCKIPHRGKPATIVVSHKQSANNQQITTAAAAEEEVPF
jgi:hypothetical protein